MCLYGFVDDDASKVGKKILGYVVLGNTDTLDTLVSENEIKEIVIAMPSVKGSIIKKVASKCRGLGCHVKILPGLYELIDGQVSVQQLRNIELEDLLPVQRLADGGHGHAAALCNVLHGYHGCLPPFVLT